MLKPMSDSEKAQAIRTIDERAPMAASSPARPEVSVVVPVYRNAETVGELASRIRAVLDRLGVAFEVLFVNDACPEGSLAVLAILADKDPCLRVVSLKRNVGQQQAILAGLARSRGREAVVMDADLQDPPEAIPVMLAGLDRGCDAVFAGRRGRYESSLRLFTSRLFKRVLHSMLRVPTDAGAFVAMSGRMKECILAMPSRGAHLVAMIGASGLQMTSVPVERARRPGGRSAYTAWGRLRVGGLAVGWVLFQGRRFGSRS